MPPKKRFAPVFAAAFAILAAGCFEHSAPRRDVTAFSPAEAATLRETATFLDFSLAQDLKAFPDDLGSFPALRRVSVRGQKSAAEVPASVAAAKGLYELDLAGTGLKDLPPEAASLPALRNLYLSDNGLAALPAAELVAEYLRTPTGYELPIESGAPKTGDLCLEVTGSDSADAYGFYDEAYRLEITAQGVKLSGASCAEAEPAAGFVCAAVRFQACWPKNQMTMSRTITSLSIKNQVLKSLTPDHCIYSNRRWNIAMEPIPL